MHRCKEFHPGHTIVAIPRWLRFHEDPLHDSPASFGVNTRALRGKSSPFPVASLPIPVIPPQANGHST
ncbi:protein of unknown function [Denitratisoma oestradiolicum]|uniref:Uncharacterized protein n=1 Tax=Denitratisoma oestradiolicum TaxID=311182 RepID=A0A6S6XUG6_9PROT|nr:protein of unknown function [Denitratisoma oestradiolicum]